MTGAPAESAYYVTTGEKITVKLLRQSRAEDKTFRDVGGEVDCSPIEVPEKDKSIVCVDLSVRKMVDRN